MEQLGDSVTSLSPRKNPAYTQIVTKHASSSSLRSSKSYDFIRESRLLPRDATPEATRLVATHDLRLPLAIHTIPRHPRSVDDSHQTAHVRSGRYRHTRSLAVTNIVMGTSAPRLSPSEMAEETKTTQPSPPLLSRPTSNVFDRRSPPFELLSLQTPIDVDDGRDEIADPSLSLFNNRVNMSPSTTHTDSGYSHDEHPCGAQSQNSDVQISGEIVQPATPVVRDVYYRPSRGVLARVRSFLHRDLPPPSPPPAYPAPKQGIPSDINLGRSDWQSRTPVTVRSSRGNTDMWDTMQNHPFSARRDPSQDGLVLRPDQGVYRSRSDTGSDRWYELIYAQSTMGAPAIDSAKDDRDVRHNGTKSASSQRTVKQPPKDLPWQSIEGYVGADGIGRLSSGPNQCIVGTCLFLGSPHLHNPPSPCCDNDVNDVLTNSFDTISWPSSVLAFLVSSMY